MPSYFSRLAALLCGGALCLAAIPACNRNKDEAPAPDVASAAAAPGAAGAAAPGGAPTSAGRPLPQEPDYIHLNSIIKDGEKSKGKYARMQLKLKANPKPGWITMLATDGSYLSAMLHYSDEFTPLVSGMKPGYVFEVDFQIDKVTTGGLPVGEMLAVDRKSAAPVADKTYFLPAIEAVKKAENLPPEAKEARRQQMRQQLEGVVNYVEERQGGASAPASAAPAEPKK